MSVLLRMVGVSITVPTLEGHSTAVVILAIALNQMKRDAEFQVYSYMHLTHNSPIFCH